MSKIKLGSIPLIYPVPIVLIGAMIGDRANFTEVGDCAIMGIRPALAVVSLSADHYTTQGIEATSVFSINLPSSSLLSKVDYCGIVSGRDVDKSALFSIRAGEHTGAPMALECPVNLECRVRETVQVEHRRIYVAHVVECYVSQDFMDASSDSKKSLPSLTKLDPIIYALDNGYYRIGERMGTGYQEGTIYQ